MSRIDGDPVARIYDNGTVTIPAELRDALDLDAGDWLRFEESDGRLVLEPVEVRAVPSSREEA